MRLLILYETRSTCPHSHSRSVFTYNRNPRPTTTTRFCGNGNKWNCYAVRATIAIDCFPRFFSVFSLFQCWPHFECFAFAHSFYYFRMVRCVNRMPRHPTSHDNKCMNNGPATASQQPLTHTAHAMLFLVVLHTYSTTWMSFGSSLFSLLDSRHHHQDPCCRIDVYYAVLRCTTHIDKYICGTCKRTHIRRQRHSIRWWQNIHRLQMANSSLPVYDHQPRHPSIHSGTTETS